MQHERRSGQRQRVALWVEIHQPGRKSVPYQARNITPGGMLLDNQRLLFETGAKVELHIHHDRRTWTIPASVTHCNSDCIGVMFSRRQAELFRAVTNPAEKLA